MAAATGSPRKKNPEFERKFQETKLSIHRELVESIDLARINELHPERLKREIRALTNEIVRRNSDLLSEVDRDRLAGEIVNEVFGYGPIQSLINDDTVSDILVNGPYEVYIERNGLLEPTDIIFANRAHLTQVIQRMAARVGRQADETSPMVDARLEDGSRINAILPPLAVNGPILSIRRFAKRLTIDQLLFNETIPPEMMTLLSAAIEARMSVLVSGGTGSGKTTMLNCLSRYIPEEERLVTIEDAIELDLQRKHVVQLETRVANLEGSGEIRQRDLVRNSLRMRPDRIILGEVRGAEALDMLQAMNTGHEGSLTTIHANDTHDALNRLEIMVMMAGYEMPVPVIRQYIGSAISLVLQLSRLKGGHRKVMRVSELVGVKDTEYELREIYGFRQMGVKDGQAFGEFYATGNKPTFLPRLEASGITLPESLFEKKTLEPSSEREWTVSLEEDAPAEETDFEDEDLWG